MSLFSTLWLHSLCPQALLHCPHICMAFPHVHIEEEKWAGSHHKTMFSTQLPVKTSPTLALNFTYFLPLDQDPSAFPSKEKPP